MVAKKWHYNDDYATIFVMTVIIKMIIITLGHVMYCYIKPL